MGYIYKITCIPTQNIRRCLNGITKKAYGYTWKEIDEE